VRLLVVEDEFRLARALQRGLTAEGYVVDLAHDGVAGLEAARHEGYDAVVLDIMLPRLSGYRIVQALRDEGNWVPVLMLSAKDGEYDQADGLDVGADDYMTKPFSFVVLLAKLRALMRRGAPERPAVLSAGTLSLDPATRRVTRDGQEIPLTAREFALLEYLMRRRDEVVTKTELLDHVWDSGADTDPNVVEVYVGYLRRKIDQPYGQRSLQTVRGAGYRLVGDGGAAQGTGSTSPNGTASPGVPPGVTSPGVTSPGTGPDGTGSDGAAPARSGIAG
jgi:DNA-binding response OmpR family regulator